MPIEPEPENLTVGLKVRLAPSQHVVLVRVAKKKLKKPAALARDIVLAYLAKNDSEYRALVEKETGPESVVTMLAVLDELPSLSQAQNTTEQATTNRLLDDTPKAGKSAAHSKNHNSKNKRGHLRKAKVMVELYVLGKPSCGKFSPAEQHPIGKIWVQEGLYPKDAYGLIADGDSMNRAKIKGRNGIKPGDVMVCRGRDHVSFEVNKIVVTERGAEVCVKRLCESAKGMCLKPESSNPAHPIIPLEDEDDHRMQAVVIDAIPKGGVKMERM